MKSMYSGADQFDDKYFELYQKKNWFHRERGERPLLYAFWTNKLGDLLPKQKYILDVGCGIGNFQSHLQRDNQTLGIDISEVALNINRTKTQKAWLSCASAEMLPLKAQSFHAVVAMDVIEHLINPENFICETYRILLPRGWLIISTPNPASYGARIKKHQFERLGENLNKEVYAWFGCRDQTHINIRSMEEWQRLLRREGRFSITNEGTDMLWDVPYFKEVPIMIQKVLFLSIHYLLTRYKGFLSWRLGENYICIAQKK